MTLYEIDKAIQEALEGAVDPESGAIIDDELLAAYDQLRMDRDQKVENIGLYIKNLEIVLQRHMQFVLLQASRWYLWF